MNIEELESIAQEASMKVDVENTYNRPYGPIIKLLFAIVRYLGDEARRIK